MHPSKRHVGDEDGGGRYADGEQRRTGHAARQGLEQVERCETYQECG
jgi:hypothetical protein